jgi:hypothetical protein
LALVILYIGGINAEKLAERGRTAAAAAAADKTIFLLW